MRHGILIIVIVAAAALMVCRPPAWAQEPPPPLDAPIEGVSGYAEDIPTPQRVIGHRIGERHTEPHQIAAYFRTVAERSDRVIVREHGRTYEGRPLIHAIVTSPANHGRLEEIRLANVRLSDAPGDVDDASLSGMPAVIYQGYSIHGNEASGSEAAMLLLHHLAAGRGPAVERTLENVVTIIDPMMNPDGRQRFTTWVNQNRGASPTADPQDREHREPWPGGRTNHYWFDPNRDWMAVRHPEGRARLELLHHWRPQVLTDHHEMGAEATYFFQPGVPKRIHPHTPDANQALTDRIAAFHAAALDRIRSLYFTRETFDDFFPGKGSTYPDLTGAVGILFEQAWSKALKRETDHGLLTYALGVRNHFATSLSTLEAAVELRRDLLRHQRDFYAEAPTVAGLHPVKAYVIGARPYPTRARALLDLLQRHRIRAHWLAADLGAGGRTFRAGEAYIVPANQPQARLIHAMLERRTRFEDDRFYDISAWTLPLAFGVPHAELRDDPAPYIGEPIEPLADRPDGDEGELVGGRARYAYLLEWGRYFSPRALHKLQDNGIGTRLMMRPFTAEAAGEVRSFDRGAIVIPLAANEHEPHVTEQTIHETVRRIAREDPVRLFAVHTGLTPDGPDLGSRTDQEVLEQPKIALVTGPTAAAYNAGEVWHLLSERFGIPISLLDAGDVKTADLSRYNTLVLAGGAYGRLDAETVKQWVQSGGRLIAMTSAVDWLIGKELVKLEKKAFDTDALLRDLPYDRIEDARGAQRISGTIFEADLDATHPLAFGYGERVALFRTHETFYEPSQKPGANVAVYGDEPLLSGYISEQQLPRVAGSAAIVAERLGAGRIVMFMDNLNFRAFWYGTNGLFLNAVFLGEAF